VHREVASNSASSGNNHHRHYHNRHEAARAHKVASDLFNEESKLLKRLGKIKKDQVKEASKIEARQQKHAEKQEKSRARGEADALRREVELLKKEVDRLRSERKQWLDLIGSLQAENTRLAAEQDPAAGTAGVASMTKLSEEKKHHSGR
jgi:thiamine kinase-like enzyme